MVQLVGRSRCCLNQSRNSKSRSGLSSLLVLIVRFCSPQDSVFGLIKEAFRTFTSKSARCRNKIDVWLLGQAVVISMKTNYNDGWKFVATSSIDLLCSLQEVKDTDVEQDDCLRSTRMLSQSLQAVKEYSKIVDTDFLCV